MPARVFNSMAELEAAGTLKGWSVRRDRAQARRDAREADQADPERQRQRRIRAAGETRTRLNVLRDQRVTALADLHQAIGLAEVELADLRASIPNAEADITDADAQIAAHERQVVIDEDDAQAREAARIADLRAEAAGLLAEIQAAEAAGATG